jgi:hypothetical protein
MLIVHVRDSFMIKKHKFSAISISGQSSQLQIRRPGFDSRHYQIF